MRLHLISALALLAAAPAFAADEPPCRAHPKGAALDFWLGDWRVTSVDGKTLFGENHVKLDLDGCAIHEDWTGATGGRGQSLFFFEARSGQWAQIWVTADTSRPGGLKHKKLVEMTDNGGVRFQGEIVGETGAPYLDRTTLTPLDGGDVRQLIEISVDGGATWRTVFDARYSRMTGNPD
jgi:hypothetical protein